MGTAERGPFFPKDENEVTNEPSSVKEIAQLLRQKADQSQQLALQQLDHDERQRIVTELKKKLDQTGMSEFFRGVKRDYGHLHVILNKGGLPWPIHFREGMHVRNILREITAYAYTPEQYDALWAPLTELAIATEK